MRKQRFKRLGVALLSRVLFADLLEQKVLTAPFLQSLEEHNAYWLMTSQEAEERHFVQWIRSQLTRERAN